MSTQRATISGFMIIKNVVSLGYPFLEAIVAVLPVCDEFLVSDGYSEDNTWEVLQVLKEKFPEKVRLYRDRWRGRTESGQVLSTMTNLLKDRCNGEYCLYVQANEIIHESSLEEIKELPLLFPNIEIFALPFYNIMGINLLWMAQFRKRLFKNKNYITSKGDAYEMGYDFKSLFPHSYRILNNLSSHSKEHTYYLPKPFYRYRAIFPNNYIKKLKTRFDLYRDKMLSYMWDNEYHYACTAMKEINLNNGSAKSFWKRMEVYFSEIMWSDLPPGINLDHLPRRFIRELDDSPKVMRNILKNRWEYDVRDSLNMLDSVSVSGLIQDINLD
jgi:hypothetical protein